MTRASIAVTFFALGVVLALALPSPASALSCNNRLVDVGDSSVYVLAMCGDPALVTTRTESRSQFVAGDVYGGVAGSVYTVTVTVEVWVYDFGPLRFMEEITMENGVIRSMRALGRGTPQGRRAAPRRD